MTIQTAAECKIAATAMGKRFGGTQYEEGGLCFLLRPMLVCAISILHVVSGSEALQVSTRDPMRPPGPCRWP